MDRINRANNNHNLAHDQKNDSQAKVEPHSKKSDLKVSTKSLAAKNISLPSKVPDNPSISADARYQIGGKGMFLTAMQQAGLSVPKFSCIGVEVLNELENLPISLTLVKQYIPDIQSTSANISISQLKNIIYKLNQEDKPPFINGFDKLLTSHDLYAFFKDTDINKNIQQTYNSINSDSKQAIIVRSSGINEDNFGDAQAGKYHSKVHADGNILTTVLELTVANLKADIVNNNPPTIVAMILQQVVKSKIGGVIMSYSSIEDNSIRMEFAPGQPKTAVCGQAGIIPHSCIITRSDNNIESSCFRGNITKQFVLEQQGNSFAEIQRPYIEDYQDHLLSKELINEITTSVQQLESLLKCPVDIEVAIDEDNRLHILQVRPITKLSGTTNFAIEMPSNSICSGELISEGLATGALFLVNNDDDLEKVPLGAIVIANHATDAMLTDEFLAKVSGFIFKNCGANDHVAITLRQAGKPCVIVNDIDTLATYNTQQVTLVAGYFNKKTGAYILNGNQTESLKANLVIDNSIDTIVNYQEKKYQKIPDFTSVDEGFQLLHNQNTKLLDYYKHDGLINLCLLPKNLVRISMSIDRDLISQNLIKEIDHFFYDLDILLQILEKYINLGANTENQEIKQRIIDYQQQLLVLKDKISMLANQVKYLINNINIFSDQDNYNKQINYDKLQEDAATLLVKLQKLYLPADATQIDSVHDLIFCVHKIFVEALATIAIGSKQGDIRSSQKKINSQDIFTEVTYISFTKTSLIDQSCKDIINSMMNRSTIIDMDGAAFINSQLGRCHFCTLAMLEDAENGKKRTLRFDFSDSFSTGLAQNGKINRAILLFLLLNHCLTLNNLSIEINQKTDTIRFEYTHIETTEKMQENFKRILLILKPMFNLDLKLSNSYLESKMSFKELEYILKNSNKTEKTFLLQRLLVSLLDRDNCFYNFEYLSETENNILTICKNLIDNKFMLQEFLLRDLTEIEEIALFHFMFSKKYTTIPANNPWIKNENLVENQLKISGNHLKFFPDKFKQNKDLVRLSVNTNGESLEFADKKFLNDLEIVTIAGANTPRILKIVNKRFTNDKQFMLSMITINYEAILFVGNELKDNIELWNEAIKQNGRILERAPEIIRDNKETLLIASNATFKAPMFTEERTAYALASLRLQQDPDIIAAFQGNSNLPHIATKLTNNNL